MTEKNLERFRLISLNISYYRKKKKLTQLELAEKLDVSRSHISNIEAPNYHSPMSFEMLFKIADALEIPPKDLLDFDR